MKNRKKGSSLVLVLIVFSILSILGMAMISLATSNYKVKILKGNIKTNMYASESGIDESYGIIGKTVDEAIIKGNNGVKEFMDTLDLTKEMKKKEILKSKMLEKYAVDMELDDLENDDSEKKNLLVILKQLDNYIINDANDSIYVKPTDLVQSYRAKIDLSKIGLAVNMEYIKEKQNEIFKKDYKEHIISKLDLINDDKKDNLIAALNKRYILKMPENQKSVVYVENFDKPMQFTNDILTIDLESAYKNKSIEKIIKADYDIYTPEYDATFYVESNSKEIDENIVWSKAICADGNMEIKDGGQVDINGSIYIKGDNRLNDGGINILNTRFTITGDISTASDVKLVSANNNTSVNGNIYARNVILTETAKNSKLTSKGSVYTSDDLELNSTTGGIVDIEGDFYGLEAGLDSITPDASSSIIINSDDLGTGSSLTIGGKSIIMGTSYINTSPEKYQTGESLSIKGNYRAYMEPLTDIDENERLEKKKGSLKVGNIIFDENNYQPLMPADKFLSNDSKLSVFDKSDYIKYYIQQKENRGEINELKTEGVNLDLEKSYHTGAIIDKKGQWKISKTELGIKELVKKKNYEYKKMVYFMGEKSITDKELNDFNKYNESVVAKQLKKLDGIDIEKKEFIIKKGDCALIFPNGNTSNLPASVPNENRKIIESEYKGIVIVDGDLYLCGEMKVTGTIICTGSIFIVDDKTKSITYDENVVKNIIATNYDLFKDIFIESNNKINVVIGTKIGSVGNSSLSINSNKLIKLKNWSLVK